MLKNHHGEEQEEAMYKGLYQSTWCNLEGHRVYGGAAMQVNMFTELSNQKKVMNEKFNPMRTYVARRLRNTYSCLLEKSQGIGKFVPHWFNC